MSDQDDLSAPGWEAIDRALAPIYQGREPKHYGTLIRYRLGGPDPLDGISAYVRETPVPHWHFVTYGFTNLYGPEEGGKPGCNGYGFELTMRLRREANEAEPPMWAVSFLQNLARYVFKSGNVLQDRDYVNCNGPIALETETALCSVLLVKDPELGPIEAPHGPAEFLQVVGITNDEEEAVQAWSSAQIIDLLRERLPLLTTDLGRRSILADPAVSELVKQGIARDGSKTHALFVPKLRVAVERPLFGANSATLVVGAGQVNRLVILLTGRLGHGRQLWLQSSDATVGLRPADECRIRGSARQLELELSSAAVQEIVERLKPQAGVVELKAFAGLKVVVERTEIADQNDKVIATIG